MLTPLRHNFYKTNSILMKKFTKHAAYVLLLLGLALNSALAQKADFSYSKPSGCSPLVVQFTNKSTSALSYVWRFGNGNQSNQVNPAAVYYKPGKYSVTLIAFFKGTKDSMVKQELIEVFSNPQVGFTANSLGGCTPFSATFADTSKKGSGKITNWLWDFGDGSTSTVKNPQHTYTNGGFYTVQLEVTDENGWVVIINMPDQTQHDFRKAKLNRYLELIEIDNWRVYKPFHLFKKIDGDIMHRLD